ncbi:MAG: TlyA family RNA methyltransferase [Proteobacteria bacterium]|nr:TlyA family RNA methyltransferase [Pseudomonadota bacterium]NDC23312.1 TlyA family RNA methyltransferase [Pseudomonadota bacterium]NDD03441.1 TlyA family RNA methyltransferase [Pseudomonadota bacterium]NDG26142.1 TlyA family RNA methyltransferase [Pseudomonadota bacterium]
MAKKRLDLLLVERGICESPQKAASLILAGEVFGPNNLRLEKPGTLYPEDLVLEVRSRSLPFKSRAGHKLQFALDEFRISVSGRTCLDIGASTGGFTHCLLKNGAKHVIAVDVGYGQLDVELRNHPQVTNLEKTNARYLTSESLGKEGTSIDLVVIDVSFISLRKIIEPIHRNFPKIRYWILLFKPQFELAPEQLQKGGKVKNLEAVQQALRGFNQWMVDLKLTKCGGPESSPIAGKKSGNVEYLIFYENRID